MNSPLLRRVWAVVPAAGRGARFESTPLVGPKQYAPLAGATVLEWSLAALLTEPRVSGIMIALAADDTRWPGIAVSLPRSKIHTAIGGASRPESVLNGLKALEGEAAADDWVLVHDAARPCLTGADLGALLDAVLGHGAGASAGGADGALLAAPIVDTVKRERGGTAVDTVDREGLWRALTPQVFRFAQLKQALEEVLRLGLAVTDEAQALERLGVRARLVRGSPLNIKVTRSEDLAMAESILRGTESRAMASKGTEGAHMRIGQGFDVHAFGAGDHVVLAGVRIDYPRGVVAHSDGDVVIHALCDAVLGALGDGDIGQHFPDSDPRYRGADSRVFLREVTARMRAAGMTLVNADVTVLAEAPRVAKHRSAMAQNLAADLGVPAERINIKATTTERLGFIGRGEGLAASAAVLLDGKPAG
ncbi:MAG: 2-C-methyl-D-erythritol 4-phosphate cytidylyltransferase [Pseudomonadota bacterium]|nr:2-C-methyl-D-erythritol 4-phosphate cytidylyltransferase [Pseudomonadota bacterium]